MCFVKFQNCFEKSENCFEKCNICFENMTSFAFTSLEKTVGGATLPL